MLPSVIVVDHEGVEILVPAEFLYFASISSSSIEGGSDGTMSNPVGTHHFGYPCCGGSVSDDVVKSVPTESMAKGGPVNSAE